MKDPKRVAAAMKARKTMMDNYWKDPEYRKTSYERQNEKRKSEIYVDDRRRVE